jgi:hypothetical protein
MRSILYDIPAHLITLVEALRTKLRDPNFLASHRVRPEDFTRQRQLTFPVLMLFILQKTIKSIQRHLHEFLDELAQGEIFEPVSSGAVTHARAKLKDTAFIELNRDCVLPIVYGAEHSIRRWREHRLFGIDSSLMRLPDSEELGQAFGWKESSNQRGHRHTLSRSSSVGLFDLLNRIGHDVRLEPSTSVKCLWPCNSWSTCSLVILRSMIAVSAATFFSHGFAARSPFHRPLLKGFLAAQEMFRLDRANQSKVVWLHAPPDQKAECRRLGLPLKIKVRFVSVRLPTGELEVLATSLLE